MGQTISFGQGPKPEQTDPVINETIRQLSTTELKIKNIEERFINMRNKTQITDQNLLTFEKDINKELKYVKDEITELNLKIRNFNKKFSMLLMEVNKAAKRTELKTLQTYLNFWNPMTFITRKEMKQILEQRKQQRNQEQNKQ